MNWLRTRLLLKQNALKWSSTIFKTLFNKAYLALTKLRELKSPSPSQIITSLTRATANSLRTPKQQRGEKLLPAIFSAKLLCVMSCPTQDHGKKWKVSTCMLFCSFPPTNTGCVTNKKKAAGENFSRTRRNIVDFRIILFHTGTVRLLSSTRLPPEINGEKSEKFSSWK